MIGDSQYNLLNGDDVRPVDVNMINKYNQDPLRGVGNAIMSGAGRPIRSIHARLEIGSPEGGKKVF